MGYRTTDLKGVEGPASATDNALVLFDGTSGEAIKNQTTITYDAGALILTGSGSAVRMDERAAGPGTSAGNAAFWVDDYATYERPRYSPGTVGTDYYILHTNAFSNTAMPYYSGITAAVSSSPFYLLQPSSRRMFFNEAGASIHIRGGASITTAPDANSGAYWVKDDGSPRFTDNAALEYNLRLGNNVSLGEWNFGNSTLGITASGTFDTDNATIGSITAIRFNATPVTGTGQSIASWSDILPQNGILYLQDVVNPGVNSVTFPYTSITFPAGAGLPQFNGPALITDGTNHGTNWSANRYSLQIISIGDFSGPASSTDNAIVRFDGTSGALVQDSAIAVGDTGNLFMSNVGVGSPAIRFSVPTSAPSPAAGTGWYYIGGSGTATTPIFKNGAGTEMHLGSSLGYWEYDSTTTAGSGGAGTVRFNNATVTSATAAYFDDADLDGTPMLDVLGYLQPGQALFLVRQDDRTQRIRLEPSSTADSTTYATINMSNVSPQASTNWTNPNDGDRFYLEAGPIGYSGGGAPSLWTSARSTAPGATTDAGKFFVRTDGANTALPEQTPWFTNDNARDMRLGMQHTTISGEVSPTAGSTWYSWGSAGPYNDTLWSDAVGTGTAPTTSNWFSRPPLILLPGDANIERVLGWYQSESATVGTWEMELVAVSIEDADTAVGTVDPIVDGSVNSDFSVTNAKITLLSHTINDRAALPTDTNHMIGLYMAFQETTGTPENVDLRFNVTIYWSTYTIDGWVSDGFAAS